MNRNLFKNLLFIGCVINLISCRLEGMYARAYYEVAHQELSEQRKSQEHMMFDQAKLNQIIEPLQKEIETLKNDLLETKSQLLALQFAFAEQASQNKIKRSLPRNQQNSISQVQEAQKR